MAKLTVAYQCPECANVINVEYEGPIVLLQDGYCTDCKRMAEREVKGGS